MQNIPKRNILVQSPSQKGAAGLLPLPQQSQFKKKKLILLTRYQILRNLPFS
jgi:hypothetical protein